MSEALRRSVAASPPSIPFHDLGPSGEPPAAALVAGLHGHGLNGAFLLARLVALLQALDSGPPGECLRRRVLVIPALYRLAAVETPDRPDPAGRVESGLRARPTAACIAKAVLALVRAATYRIDVHSCSPDLEELPQVQLSGAGERERAHAAWLGLPAVIQRPAAVPLRSGFGPAAGGERFVIRAGQAGCLQHHHCEVLLRALIRFLRKAGILPMAELAGAEDGPLCTGEGRSLAADASGMFVSNLEVGRWVRAGELLGQVYDGCRGRVLADARAPVGGLLTALRRQPLVRRGDTVARVHPPVSLHRKTGETPSRR